jgi:VanZ family protein
MSENEAVESQPYKLNFGTVRLRSLLRAAWFLAVGVVVVGSLLGANSLPIRELARLHLNDKFEHFAAYAALAFLPAAYERPKLLMVAGLCLVILGILLEFGQMRSAGRSFEISDMIADAAGVVAGAACGLAVYWNWRRNSSN